MHQRFQTTARSVRSIRNGLVAPFVIFGIVALGLVGVGIYYWTSMGDATDMIQPIMANVTRGEFVSQVLDQGEIQSSENVEIRCEVRARNGSLSVLSVVPEGTRVKAGDFLVQLDSTSFEKELEQQNISMANAETQVIQAESNLETARATKEEYVEGTFKQNLKLIQNEIFDAESEILTARQQMKTAQDTYAHSKKLQAKGFVTAQSLEADKFKLKNAEIALDKGELSLELAKEKKRVLEKISYKKETVQLEADIKAADVKLRSEKKAFGVEKEKLAEIKEMVEKCRIVVPEGVSGQVVYAKESSRGGNDWILEEGTSVRQNQVLVRLPNPEKMEVKALINEQSITQIETGMPATIKVDALNSTTLKGVVTKVNQYAESSGWMSSSVRKYAVIVKILDPPEALKPGMNSSVTIQVQYESDVLLAPIQSIYAVQERQFCLVKKGENEWETLEVEIGGDNSQMVLIRDGIEEGKELVMNPGAYKELMDLPETQLDTRIELPEGVADKAKNNASKKMAGAGTAAMGEGKAGGKKDGARGEGGGGRGAGRQGGGGRPGGSGAGGGRPGGGGGAGGFSMPENGKALISSKDTDGDGKLTKEEAGSPYSYFFDRVDTDSDGFISESEADVSIKSMKARMSSGGGFGGGGGRGGGQ